MSDKREGNEFAFVSCVFRWFWRDLVKCYVSVQVTYLLDSKNSALFLILTLGGVKVKVLSNISIWIQDHENGNKQPCTTLQIPRSKKMTRGNDQERYLIFSIKKFSHKRTVNCHALSFRAKMASLTLF